MATQLNDKVAVVTGSSSGIGEAIATMFASRGAKVTLCGRNQERLKSVFDKLVKISGGHQERFLTVQGDLNDPSIRKELVDQTIKTFGRLDILVANAGVLGLSQSVVNATEELYDTIMDTNLKSCFFLVQQAVPHLEKSKGCIVNISSISTTMAIPDATIYTMSKVALDHLTRCLAVELGPKGIRVNEVNPGFIPTLVLREHAEDVDKINREITKIELSLQPLKEKIPSADDVAEAVMFFVSDAANFITGERIRVDGGRHLGPPIDWSALKQTLK